MPDTAAIQRTPFRIAAGLVIGLTAGLALSPAKAATEKPLTLACAFVEMAGPAFDDRYKLIDRVTVDFAAQTLNLQVTATMGSAIPVDWTYENRKKTGVAPNSQIMLNRDEDGVITVVALRCYTSTTFVFAKPYLIMTAVSQKGVVSQVGFLCTQQPTS